MPKKRQTGRQAELMNLETALCLNGQATKEGPKRKTWNMHDLKTIKPLTTTQEEMFQSWYNGYHLCAHGSAGTGKTFLAFYLALEEVLSKRQNRIILVRSAVPTRDVGFLPGDLNEKLMQYEQPYHDILWELIGRPSTYQDMKDSGLIEFHSTSFLRGLTWDNAIVIVDEAENMEYKELDTIITRIGKNCRVVLCGDIEQTDLTKKNETSGLPTFIRVLEEMKSFSFLHFTEHDIVRSGFVKEYLLAKKYILAA